MRRDVRFLLIYILRFCVQIELTDILEINSDSSERERILNIKM